MIETSETIRELASDWADKFDQACGDWSFVAWVGKRIEVSAPPSREGGPSHRLIAVIAGYSRSVLYVDGRMVKQYELITDEGKKFPILAGTSIVEVDEADVGP